MALSDSAFLSQNRAASLSRAGVSYATVERVREAALAKASALAEASLLALQLLKRGIGASFEVSRQALLAMELDTLGFFWQSEDRKEGLSAFLEKRRPAFKGR